MLSGVQSDSWSCPALITKWYSLREVEPRMSMMVNPSGHNQIIAAGQPFKLRMPRKKLSTEPEEPTEQPPAEDEDDGGDEED